jgi:ribosomal protein S18 acetylase RimI-like enzyme
VATAPDPRGRPDAPRVRVRILRPRDRETALARLRPHARDDLFLMDLVRQVGASAGHEMQAEVLGAWHGDQLAGLASLRPTVVLEAGLGPAALAALVPALAGLASGLVRSPSALAGPLWTELERRGRRSLVDRLEMALVVEAADARLVDPPPGSAVRRAGVADLDPLVEAARASLREEGRPDPFLGDPRGFRRWVAARLPRAVVIEHAGRVAWVGYGDVRLPEGWLLQGVYTWPEARRRGLAAAGVSALCREAFAAGADHVQLSVVGGNEPALGLYHRLGFRDYATLRTLLFA